jgi:hypothetical protein
VRVFALSLLAIFNRVLSIRETIAGLQEASLLPTIRLFCQSIEAIPT